MRRVLAPLALAVLLAVFLLAVLPNDVPEGLAAILLLGTQVIVAAILSALLFYREQLTRPDVRTHFRQCIALYCAALFGWTMQGEGLTAHAGMVILRGAIAIILGQAASTVMFRARSGWKSHASQG